VQNAVDDKHNLIVHTQAPNTNDGKALHKAAMQTKQNLQLQKEDTLMLLADKGYHTGAELHECQQENMTTHVAYKEQPGVKHIANEFLAESFEYNKLTDTYTCPAGAVLTTLGTWHNKKGEAGETSYRFKTYRTEACKTCAVKINAPNCLNVLCSAVNTRMRWTSMITTSNKTHSITNEDRPFANILLEVSNDIGATPIRY
jgi:hypothetical protein